MSSRRNHKPNTKPCTCNVCDNTAVSVPGTTHRRCPGQPPSAGADGVTSPHPIRPKHQNLTEGNRGRWE